MQLWILYLRREHLLFFQLYQYYLVDLTLQVESRLQCSILLYLLQLHHHLKKENRYTCDNSKGGRGGVKTASWIFYLIELKIGWQGGQMTKVE
jgi:hypothetical protein